MHPTIDEQLEGAQRLLDTVAADPALSADSAESLANVRRLLKQAGRSWSQLLPFYTQDNADLRALLARMGPLLLGDSASSDDPVSVDGADDGDRHLDVGRAAARNAKLRQQLSAALVALPDTDDGRAARDDIATYLRARVAKDPS